MSLHGIRLQFWIMNAIIDLFAKTGVMYLENGMEKNHC